MTIILVGSVFVVYFFLLYLCRQADEHDAKKGGVLHLADNHGNDRQKYEVIVETGLRHGAGTTAKVSVSCPLFVSLKFVMLKPGFVLYCHLLF